MYRANNVLLYLSVVSCLTGDKYVKVFILRAGIYVFVSRLKKLNNWHQTEIPRS